MVFSPNLVSLVQKQATNRLSIQGIFLVIKTRSGLDFQTSTRTKKRRSRQNMYSVAKVQGKVPKKLTTNRM
jgi:hypothetical protein